MYVIRPAREDDLDALIALAAAGGAGLTTLPKSRGVLSERIATSLASFAKEVVDPGEEYYLFVLEQTETGEVVGTSGIFARVGLSKPFYNYRLLRLTQVSAEPPLKVDTSVLHLANEYAGKTEIGTLFLHPEHRAGGVGRLLSKCRYLFIAGYPERFADFVMAELRGWVNDAGESPFWNALGAHFFAMSYPDADRLSGIGDNQFIADLMPKFPIYTSLLPKAAQEVIGKPHDNAAAALKMLKAEGFRFDGGVDIFDAGPCVQAPRDEIRTVATTKRAKAAIAEQVPGEPDHLMANATLENFRVVATPIRLEGDSALVTAKVAEALALGDGDPVLYAPMRMPR